MVTARTSKGGVGKLPRGYRYVASAVPAATDPLLSSAPRYAGPRSLLNLRRMGTLKKFTLREPAVFRPVAGCAESPAGSATRKGQRVVEFPGS